MKCLIQVVFLLVLATGVVRSQTFTIQEKGVFAPQKKKVVLFQDAQNRKLILFKTKLQVNTDGTPISYHPFDLGGNKMAINTVANAIAVRKLGAANSPKLPYKESLAIFQQYRDSHYETIPVGYSITWKNVLIPRKENGKDKPCIFKEGAYKGYFASATSLKNGLKQDKSECGCDNQVNPLKVPALVLVGGNDNVVKKFGAQMGDLLVAYNPNNQNIVYAIINDYGPRTNLGEGSVLLNMMLLNRKEFPKTRKDTYSLVTPKDIVVSIIPKSNLYYLKKPYTLENIKERILFWMNEAGFETESEYIEFINKNRNEL